MTPLSSEFDKFVKKCNNFMENTEQHIEFLKQQLIHTKIELYALKNNSKRQGAKMIPPKINLGQHYNKTIACIMRGIKKQDGYVLGFKIPYFQRYLVWTREQKIKLIESLFVGIHIGSYTVNEFYGSEYDFIVIDGQQRLNAIESYINDDFKVYDMLYSELTIIDKRRFDNSLFPQYVTQTDDIEYLKNYYNLMNFGGTAHKESDRA